MRSKLFYNNYTEWNDYYLSYYNKIKEKSGAFMQLFYFIITVLEWVYLR